MELGELFVFGAFAVIKIQHNIILLHVHTCTYVPHMYTLVHVHAYEICRLQSVSGTVRVWM